MSDDVKELRERLLSRAERASNGCLEWQGTTGSTGYGQLRFEGRNQRAHRVMWIAFRGEIPDGLCVCHSCDNRACVELSHLFLGTALDNTRDMDRKKRRDLQAGETNGNAKLSAEDVAEIRRLHAAGLSHPEVAHRFNIDRSNVSLIVLGKAWRHVQ